MVLIEAIDTFQLNHWTWVQASGDQHQVKRSEKVATKLGFIFFTEILGNQQ